MLMTKASKSFWAKDAEMILCPAGIRFSMGSGYRHEMIQAAPGLEWVGVVAQTPGTHSNGSSSQESAPLRTTGTFIAWVSIMKACGRPQWQKLWVSTVMPWVTGGEPMQ